MGQGLRLATLAAIKSRCSIDERGCWVAPGRIDKDGYVLLSKSFNIDGHRVSRSHRVTFYLKHGTLPALLDHVVCDNRACCNPDHVAPSNNKANTLRGAGPTAENARKTHCKRGHELPEPNFAGGKWRRCPACRRIRGD